MYTVFLRMAVAAFVVVQRPVLSLCYSAWLNFCFLRVPKAMAR